MRIIVCGGRNYTDTYRICNVLNIFNKELEITLVIHGDATGVDTIAAKWAEDNNIKTWAFPAEWDKYGNYAGPKRNTRMLEEGKPEFIIAFPGGTGTANMVKQAKKANIKVVEIK